ncbi:MAG: alpha/beta hydrolase [Clostridia bacterium]|nr:alpha/beta hydrolase [Clostridia bacterium]
MKRRTKIILWIAGILIIILLAVVLFGANYLVTFAIARSTGLQNIAPESTLSDEALQDIVDTWQVQARQAEDWMGSSDVQEISIQSDDGLTLRGEAIITDPESHSWVLAVHGYRSSRASMRALASYYGLRGYNTLIPDLRGCGESEGEYVGMGWPDRLDMLGWIRWITEKDPEASIVLHGISMGGATVMMTAGEMLPEQVKAIVEDCGYTSVWDIFEDEMAYLFHLPAFPMLYVASSIASNRAGYSFTEASSLHQIAKAQVPVLFIHGSEDNFVHTDMVYKVYDACPTEKQLLVVDGAGHGNSYNHAPDLYFDTVFGFLGSYMPGEQ